jgi:hypothetical protein
VYETKHNIAYVPSSAVLPLSGAPSPEVNVTYADYTGNSVFNPVSGSGSYSLNDCALFKEFEVINQPLVFFLPDVIGRIENNPTAKSATISNSARTGTLVTITTVATHGFLVGDTVTICYERFPNLLRPYSEPFSSELFLLS